MYAIMDMGTTNTRLYMCKNDEVIGQALGAFGAGFGKNHGRQKLIERVNELLCELICKLSVSKNDVKCIVGVGMAGSEIGLCDVPHISLPVDARTLAQSVQEKKIDGIDVPLLFIPGVKKCEGDEILDMMRGEECETVGLCSEVDLSDGAIFVLPGTHNKIVSVSSEGDIRDLSTTFSGELLNSIISGTILAGEVTHDFHIVESEVLLGALYAKENGLNAALFHIRVMAKSGADPDVTSSFLYGAVLSADIQLIKRLSQGKKIYVSGRKTLRDAYSLLLGEGCATALEDCVCSKAMVGGAMLIKRIYDRLSQRELIKEKLEREKVVVIIRNPKKESLNDAVSALYNGGIRLAEVTFDRSGRRSVKEIGELIRELVVDFRDMCIGAGTVTRKEEVYAAFEAGASYIISPNCDPDIIALTKKLGMVSMPAAYTASEIVSAMNSGADYVKLFPAGEVSAEYVKAVCAPISDAKLFAVGGVNIDNAKDFLKMGFCGIGVGSNLYDKRLIEEKKFDALSALAKKYSSLALENDEK